jgi:hypothetical protein
MKNTNSKPSKHLFTSIQVFAELNNQGIRSIKGEVGADLLYKNLYYAYYHGDHILKPEIVEDLGFDIGKLEERDILCGEFKLTTSYSLIDFLANKYEVSLNSAVTNVL